MRGNKEGLEQMPRRDYYELREKHKDGSFIEAFSTAYGISALVLGALVSDSWRPGTEETPEIVLSDRGEELLQEASDEIDDLSHDEACFAALLALYHDTLLIDLEQTDFQTLTAMLSNEIEREAIRFPWIYDRLLEERFPGLFSRIETSLSASETETLLEGTPQGVFQMGSLVAGPFGLLRAAEERVLPPRAASILHCTDPSCHGIHSVELTLGENPIIEAAMLLRVKALEDGEPSDWHRFFLGICGREAHWYDDMHSGELPVLLANALSEDELRSAVRTILEQPGGVLRAAFAQIPHHNERFAASAQEIASSLSRAEALQTVLLVDDVLIIESIERAIDRGVIAIPPTESRNAVHTIGGIFRGSLAVDGEIARAGVRFRPSTGVWSTARLKRLVMNLYPDDRAREDLEWKLRDLPGTTWRERLDAYLQSGEPRDILKTLVLESRSRLEAAFADLRWGHFTLPSESEEEERLLERLLWKIGFEVDRYPVDLQRYWQRHETFLGAARVGNSTFDEAEREAIRAAGVNLFVSVEDVLERGLSFLTWSLLHDHYGDEQNSRFVYNPIQAKRFMASVLDGRELGEGRLEISGTAGNTLYGLITGYRVLADVCEEIRNTGTSQFERRREDQPGWVGKLDLQVFPFISTHPFLDLESTSQDRITAFMRSITSVLDQATIASVRNRIDHTGGDFPTRSEIEGACGALATLLTEMEADGFYPNVCLYAGTATDRYGRRIAKLADYRGRVFGLKQPSELEWCDVPISRDAQIVFRAAQVKGTTESLRFSYQEESEYVAMWRDYPRRLPLGDGDPHTDSNGMESHTETVDTLSGGNSRLP